MVECDAHRNKMRPSRDPGKIVQGVEKEKVGDSGLIIATVRHLESEIGATKVDLTNYLELFTHT